MPSGPAAATVFGDQVVEFRLSWPRVLALTLPPPAGVTFNAVVLRPLLFPHLRSRENATDLVASAVVFCVMAVVLAVLQRQNVVAVEGAVMSVRRPLRRDREVRACDIRAVGVRRSLGSRCVFVAVGPRRQRVKLGVAGRTVGLFHGRFDEDRGRIEQWWLTNRHRDPQRVAAVAAFGRWPGSA